VFCSSILISISWNCKCVFKKQTEKISVDRWHNDQIWEKHKVTWRIVLWPSVVSHF
jgi:hypothetical protein